MKTKLNALTGLRFVAASHVLLFHSDVARMPGVPSIVGDIIQRGPASVSLFFVLSGFVLTYSDHFDDRPKFYWSRFARVYPLYLFGLIIAIPMLARTPNLDTVPAQIASGTMVLGLVQAWTPGTARYWNCAAWSLSAEAFFYAVFPLIASPARRLNRRQLVAAIGLLFLASEVPTLAYRVVWPTNPDLPLMLEFNPMIRLPEFLIGIAAGRLFLLDRPQPAGAMSVVAAAVATAMLTTATPPWAGKGALTLVFAVLVYALAAGGGPLAWLLSRRPTILLGESSYALYITHIPVIYLTWEAGRSVMGWNALILLSSAVAIAASIVAHLLLDLPAQRLLLNVARSAPSSDGRTVSRRLAAWRTPASVRSPGR